MPKFPPLENASPWHDGERTVRRLAGVEERMEAIGPRAIINSLLPAHRAFYAKLPYAVFGTIDEGGYPWATLIAGVPGFMDAPDAGHVHVKGRLQTGDPAAAGWKSSADIAVLGIELLSRRRIRANGVLDDVTANSALLRVRQAFGNCPKYIQARDVGFASDPATDWFGDVSAAETLSEPARSMIASADTFFVASYTDRQDNVRRAVDVSHRGGRPGFVRVEGNRLSIPDFTGNHYFNTLGNFLHIPRAGLAFLSFETGDLLQVAGDVTIDFDSTELHAFAGAERVWHLDVRQFVLRRAVLPLRFNSGEPSPNSLATGSWVAVLARIADADRADRWLPFRVSAITQESQDITSFVLSPAGEQKLPSFSAGQHVPIRVQFPQDAGTAERLYTVSSAPEDNILRISVKREGRVSSFLHDGVREGHALDIRVPRGGFTLLAGETRPLVLASAGVGITPMVSMLRHLVHEVRRTGRMRDTWFVHGARDRASRAFDAEIADLARASRGAATLIRLLSSPDPISATTKDFDIKGRLGAETLCDRTPLATADIYLCGPPAFMGSMYAGLRRFGVPDGRIFAESFGPAGLQRDSSLRFEPIASATGPVSVRFTRSGRTIVWSPGDGSLLDCGLSHGVPLASSCRIGQCGTCRVAIRQGAVSYQSAPLAGLTRGTALLCQALPAMECDLLEVDA